MTKTCFIISTIGKEGKPEREKSDEKLNHLFIPVLKELGYSWIRADQEDSAGSISRAIVERVINSEMVIADISDQNPNVFYEIAIRNAVHKPLIIIRSTGQKPPFDIQDTRAIGVDMSKPNIWRPAMDKLKKQIESAVKDPKKASESILSDFTFNIETDKKVDKESEVLLHVKDLQGQVKRVDKKLQQIDRQTQPLPTFTPSPFDITTNASTFDLGTNRSTVACKDCNTLFQILRPIAFVSTEEVPLSYGTCPSCNKTNAYSDDDFVVG